MPRAGKMQENVARYLGISKKRHESAPLSLRTDRTVGATRQGLPGTRLDRRRLARGRRPRRAGRGDLRDQQPDLPSRDRRGAAPPRQALRWMHFTSAGIDRGIAMGIPEGLIVTNSAGLRAGNVSEHALMLLLALTRRLPNLMACQRAHDWQRAEMTPHITSIEDAVVCVIGRGPIGRELARKLKGVNARPIAVSRTPDGDGDRRAGVSARTPARGAGDRRRGRDLHRAATTTSRHMIGAAEFAAMKPGALIVNVARGSIIDEAALIAALREGRIAGAGLDVVATEPMPAANPLWDMPNVIVSPHVAGQGSSGYPGSAGCSATISRASAPASRCSQCQLCEVPAHS